MPAAVRFNPKPVVLTGALIALLAAAAPASAGNGGFAPVPPESPNAEGITESFWLVSAICFAIFLLVEGLLIAFVIRYRRRNRPRDADGAQIHGSTALELAWTAGPVLILVVIATFVFVKLPGIQDVPAATGGTRNLVVDVTGSQFMWEYRYPNGVLTVDRLRVPEGRTVELRVSAPDWDVIHSWWIPALGGKIDAIPGTINHTWFKAERTGVFDGQCAELCGIYHAKMTAAAEVLPADEFDAWLEERRAQQEAGTSPLGDETWRGSCAKCHGLDGEGGYGPRIAGTELIEDPAAVDRLLRTGRGNMPPVGRDWDDTQLEAVNTYLEQNLGG
jgi:cytochrome c oxidase subunit II